MFGRTARACLVGLMALASAPSYGEGWGTVSIISSTLGNNAGRICTGANDTLRPGDIGCPSYAPSLTTAGDVSVTGNLSASKFIGDGSLLTGVAAASSDRIVSGTGNATSMVAISNTGYISVTQAGANSAWFDPARGLVTLGVSSTGGISGSTGYFYGNVGIGTTGPASKLTVYDGTASAAARVDAGNWSTLFLNNDIDSNNSGSDSSIRFEQRGSHYAEIGIDGSDSNKLKLFTGTATFGGAGVTIDTSGRVGIGTTAPQATLQVSGSFIVSTSAQTTTPSFYVGTNGNVGVGTSSPGDKFVLNNESTSTNDWAGGALRVNRALTPANRTYSVLDVWDGGTYWPASIGATYRTPGGYSLDFAVHSGVVAGTSPTTRMTILGSGNVGIGTTAPQATLQVSGSFIVSTSAQTTTPSLYVGTNGNVGVGTSGPLYDIHIVNKNNTVGNARLALERYSAASNALVRFSNSSDVGLWEVGLVSDSTNKFAIRDVSVGYLPFRIEQDTATNTLSLVKLVSGTAIGGIGIGKTTLSGKLHVASNGTLPAAIFESGPVGIGWITPSVALEVSGTVSATNFVGNGSGLTGITATTDRLTSGTTNVTAYQNTSITFTTAGSQRMVVDENGNVGVGTAAPLYALHVSSTGAVAARFGDASTSGLNIGTASSAGSSLGLGRGLWGNNSELGLGYGNGPIVFHTGTSWSASERVRITSAGNVGIGTTAPQATLQVSGSFIVSVTGQTTTPSLYVGTNGNVGVGTATPSRLLEIAGSSAAANTVPAIQLTDTAGNANSRRWMIGNSFATNYGDLSFAVGINNSSNPANVSGVKMTIDKSGNVGIGTTAPTKTLEVSGTAFIASNTVVSGTVMLSGMTSEPCTASIYGTIRFDPDTKQLQICRK